MALFDTLVPEPIDYLAKFGRLFEKIAALKVLFFVATFY